MEKIYLDIAGFTFQVNLCPTQYQFYKNKFIRDIKEVYRNCITAKPLHTIEYLINVREQSDLMALLENKKKGAEGIYMYLYHQQKQIINTFYTISINQFMYLLILLTQKLLIKNRGFMFHASASNINGSAVLFTGPSEAGKSTIVALLSKKYPILSDDTAIIKKETGQYYFYQNPRIDKNSSIVKSSVRYPISKLFFLKKAKNISWKKIENQEYIITQLSPQIWSNPENLKVQMKFLLDFAASFARFYLLSFPKDEKIAIDFFQKSIQHEI